MNRVEAPQFPDAPHTLNLHEIVRQMTTDFRGVARWAGHHWKALSAAGLAVAAGILNDQNQIDVSANSGNSLTPTSSPMLQLEQGLPSQQAFKKEVRLLSSVERETPYLSFIPQALESWTDPVTGKETSVMLLSITLPDNSKEQHLSVKTTDQTGQTIFRDLGKIPFKGFSVAIENSTIMVAGNDGLAQNPSQPTYGKVWLSNDNGVTFEVIDAKEQTAAGEPRKLGSVTKAVLLPGQNSKAIATIVDDSNEYYPENYIFDMSTRLFTKVIRNPASPTVSLGQFMATSVPDEYATYGGGMGSAVVYTDGYYKHTTNTATGQSTSVQYHANDEQYFGNDITAFRYNGQEIVAFANNMSPDGTTLYYNIGDTTMIALHAVGPVEGNIQTFTPDTAAKKGYMASSPQAASGITSPQIDVFGNLDDIGNEAYHFILPNTGLPLDNGFAKSFSFLKILQDNNQTYLTAGIINRSLNPSANGFYRLPIVNGSIDPNAVWEKVSFIKVDTIPVNPTPTVTPAPAIHSVYLPNIPNSSR